MVLAACGPTASPASQDIPDSTSTSEPLTASSDPELVLTLTAGRLEKPVLPPHPGQADEGAVVYWLVCIPCHGDKGQGLTDEWRLVFGTEDMNCWRSKCHAANHPPEGFVFPRTVPPVLGEGALARLTTAQELYHVISTTMPWWDPDYVNQEDAWNLTAYLMRQEGTLPVRAELDDGSAPAFRLHNASVPTRDERPEAIAVAALVAIAAVALVARAARHR
jgi:mono/diheme cytochrome c family protein